MSAQTGGLRTVALAVVVTIVLLVVGLRYADVSRQAIVEGKRQAEAEARTAALIAEGVLVIPVVDSLLVADDPTAPAWRDVPSLDVKVTPQNVTMPVLDEASVNAVQLQGIADGERIAWRLSWPDPTPDMNVDTGRFSDAVALQFPVSGSPPHTMGGPHSAVHILQWKGIWQKDVDEHFQDVQDLHPNYWADLYWFASGTFPFRVPDAFADTTSQQWFVAYEAGNPGADFHRRQPVEELMAEGYGSLTPQEQSSTTGRGVWSEGRWSVVFTRPLQTNDPFDCRIYHGSRGQVAVAVWDGSSTNVGGRKHFSEWYSFEVQL